MSAQKLTKKQKKGLAFRERKGKKPSDAVPGDEDAVPVADVPVDEEEVVAEVRQQPLVVAKGPAEKGKKQKRDAVEGGDTDKGKKRKRDAMEDGDKDNVNAAGDRDVGEKSARRGKKRKVAKGNAEEGKKEGAAGDKAKAASAKTRFILFVGNLKYTTSLEAIQEHFSACDPPPQIRLLTPKPKSPSSSTAKSKGCAFLEFSHRNALQQGLKLHGSTLDSRRINVELTAGGGGKSENRVQKVQARNKQLLEERKTRVQKEVEVGGKGDAILIAPPQRHSTTSGVEEFPQKRRTWTVPEEGEVSGRGGVKKRGKKGKTNAKDWGTGANAVTVG